MSNSKSGLTQRSKSRFIRYSILITVIYLVVFGYLSVRPFDKWTLSPFVDGMLAVFMGAGAIAIITGIILVVQSVIESERDKKQKVFDQKLALYSGIIEQMESFYRLKEEEDVPIIDQQERMNLFFTQLKIALLARPKTFRSFSQLINDIADDDGVIKEEAAHLLLEFVMDARNDLDVQEEMTPEDQQSLNESMEIAEKAATNIQTTGRATYFVSENPFQQYIDQFTSPAGREEAGHLKRRWNRVPGESTMAVLQDAHRFLEADFEGRDGVFFDYSKTGGCACFALNKKRNGKWCYLRFEDWKGIYHDENESEITTLYLLRPPRTNYEVPKIDGVLTAQSPFGTEWFFMKLERPEQFSQEVKDLVEESFQTRVDGTATEERLPKKELIAKMNQDWSDFVKRNPR